jgi:hypothetical protein
MIKGPMAPETFFPLFPEGNAGATVFSVFPLISLVDWA